MYSTKIYLVFVLISTTWAGILPKSRRPLRHGYRYRNGFILGQIELRDPSIDIDNYALRKSDKRDDPLQNNEDTNELFGKNGIIYLSNPRNKNNLLNTVAEQMAVQYLRLREPEDQDQEIRSDEDVGLGDLRRAEGVTPKLVYDFNELVV